MIRKIAPLMAMLCVPFILGFGPPKLVESDSQRMPVYATQLPEIAESSPPFVQARAALIMDAATGRVVYQRDATKRLALASITKVMTAIVALERGNLSDSVTVRPEFMIEGSTMGLTPGDVLTLEDLLWGMMLPSGNDAAYTIAYHVGGGSISNFVGMMNQKARQLGLKDTHFSNPHGLDEEGHYSSAYDIAKMSRYALRIPKFAEVVRTRIKEVRDGRGYVLLNNNNLLDKAAFLGVDGVKTGFTDNAGDSIVASATKAGRRVLVVAMGTGGRDQAASALIDYAFSSFGWVPITSPFLTYSQAKSEVASLSPKSPPAVMVPQWQMPFVSLLPLSELGFTTSNGRLLTATAEEASASPASRGSTEATKKGSATPRGNEAVRTGG